MLITSRVRGMSRVRAVFRGDREKARVSAALKRAVTGDDKRLFAFGGGGCPSACEGGGYGHHLPLKASFWGAAGGGGENEEFGVDGGELCESEKKEKKNDACGEEAAFRMRQPWATGMRFSFITMVGCGLL